MTTTRNIRELTLERGACYGTCPVYRVTVAADGRVTWDGEMFVDVLGPREWVVPSTAVAALEAALARAGFHELRSAYTDFDWTDAPSVSVSVIYADGTKKVVDHYHGCADAPRTLTALENRIDRILGTKAYIGRSGVPDADKGGEVA